MLNSIRAQVAGTDGETTGLDPFRHDGPPDEMWEYAIVLPRPNGDGFDERLWQFWPSWLGNEFLSMSNFHQRHHPYLEQWNVATMEVGGHWRQSSRAEAAAEICSILAGRHIVGIVTGFDDMFLRPLLSAYGLRPTYHYHVICAEVHVFGFIHGWHAALAALPPHIRAEVGIPGPPLRAAGVPWQAEELLDAVGVRAPTGIDRHSALADARWALSAYLSTLASDTPAR